MGALPAGSGGTAGSSARVAVAVEAGTKKVFASALDWPGWCRSGRDEQAALDALAACAERYAVVAAGEEFPGAGAELTVVDRQAGGGNSDWAPMLAAPSEVRDRSALPPAEMERAVRLLSACWARLDEVVAQAPAILRKGPRGGGRDRDEVMRHVVAAETDYARRLGIRVREADLDTPAAVAHFRGLIVSRLRGYREEPEERWTELYAIRRFAWHALDHAWEIEDRSVTDAETP